MVVLEASHRPAHPALSSAPRGQSLSKQTSKMKSLGCCTKYAIRRNIPPDANEAQQDDDDDDDDKEKREEQVVGGTELAGKRCPLHSRGVGDANIRLKSVETNPQGIPPPWRTDQGGQLIWTCPGWQVNTAHFCV